MQVLVLQGYLKVEVRSFFIRMLGGERGGPNTFFWKKYQNSLALPHPPVRKHVPSLRQVFWFYVSQKWASYVSLSLFTIFFSRNSTKPVKMKFFLKPIV